MGTQEKHRHYINFDIAGFTYWDRAFVLCDMKPCKNVRLIREENNRFEQYGVAFWYEKSKLGFVPRGQNLNLSKFLEMGYENFFDARIHRVASEEHPEHQVSVIIYLKRNIQK